MVLPEYYEADKTYFYYAIGPADLTDWINNKIALLAAELNDIDGFRGGYLTPTDPIYAEYNAAPADMIPDKILTGRTLGRLTTNHYLQTSIFDYIVSGVCTTTEATPNIHTQTLNVANLSPTPIRAAFHLEKETPTANIERRVDAFGIANAKSIITCSEKQTIANRAFSCNIAYTGDGGDLGKTSKLSTTIHPPYNWFDLISGGITITYGDNPLAMDVVGVQHETGWSGYEFDSYDSSAYPGAARVKPPFQYPITLSVRPYDHATEQSIWGLRALSLTASAYAGGDLDIQFYYKHSATKHIKYTYDKMYMFTDWEEMYQSEGDWFDGYNINFGPISHSSSLVIEEKNTLNNDCYENPA